VASFLLRKHDVIEWLIACGRDLGDVKNTKGEYWQDGEEYSALEIARKIENSEVVALLEDSWPIQP